MTRSALISGWISVTLLACGLALTGCAQGGAGTAAPGPSPLPSVTGSDTAAPSPGTSASPAPRSAPGCAGGVQTGTVTLSEKDSGRQICLATGTHLEVYLQGTVNDRWSAPVPDSDALRPAPSGKGALMMGVTGGFFVAVHPGQARLTAARDTSQFDVVVSVS